LEPRGKDNAPSLSLSLTLLTVSREFMARALYDKKARARCANALLMIFTGRCGDGASIIRINGLSRSAVPNTGLNSPGGIARYA